MPKLIVRSYIAALLVWVVLSTSWAHAQTTAASAPSPALSSADAPVLQAVTVTGVQPGPGLWKVSKDNHVLWVLGTLSPLPKRMRWRSAEVENVIAHSQEVLEPPTAELKVDAGFFRKLALLPSVYSARKNPNGQNLQQILPPDMFTRWQTLKRQYFGSDRGIEYWRPILVALKLYQKALDAAGLTNGNEVNKTVFKLADRHDVKRVKVAYQWVLEHPRDAVETVKQTNLHDVSCFNQTLNTVQNDMGALAARANAWATGDIEALRRFALSNRHESCVIAVVNANFAQQLGLHDLPQRIENTWLDAAQAAMTRNAQTFALLPMDKVLSPDGFLARLQAHGYRIQAPDDLDSTP